MCAYISNFLAEYVPLTIFHHLYFLCISQVGTRYITSQWGNFWVTNTKLWLHTLFDICLMFVLRFHYILHNSLMMAKFILFSILRTKWHVISVVTFWFYVTFIFGLCFYVSSILYNSVKILYKKNFCSP